MLGNFRRKDVHVLLRTFARLYEDALRKDAWRAAESACMARQSMAIDYDDDILNQVLEVAYLVCSFEQ